MLDFFRLVSLFLCVACSETSNFVKLFLLCGTSFVGRFFMCGMLCETFPVLWYFSTDFFMCSMLCETSSFAGLFLFSGTLHAQHAYKTSSFMGLFLCCGSVFVSGYSCFYLIRNS